MNRMTIFQVLRSGRFSALFALVGLALLFIVSDAKAAGCGVLPYKTVAAASAPFVSPHGDDRQEGEDSNGFASIVGLWHLVYTATDSTSGPLPVPVIPPGPPTSFQFLESFKTWHADGTEFENAFLPPAGGNICFGVWKDLGYGKVKLHHIGLMFGGPGSVPPEDVTNIFTVDETDTVAPNGKTYSGFFDFKLYLPSDCANGAGGYVCTGKPIAEVTGTTYGVRITVD